MMLSSKTAGNKFLRFIFCGFFLIFIFCGSAAAFSFKKAYKGREGALMIETPQYRILFSEARASVRKDDQNPKIRWVELSYKYADLEEPPGQRFAGMGGGKIRFLDKDSFVLASDVFSIQDLEAGDIYGFLWVEENRIHQIVSADAVLLRPEEVKLLKEKEDHKTPSPSPEPETSAETKPVPSPSPSAEPLPQPNAEVAPSAEVSPSPSAPPPSPVPTPSVPATPAPPASTAPDMVIHGGVSNEDLSDTLGNQLKKPETVIPPSKTVLPIILEGSEEKVAVVKEAPKAKEDDENGVIIKQTFE